MAFDVSAFDVTAFDDSAIASQVIDDSGYALSINRGKVIEKKPATPFGTSWSFSTSAPAITSALRFSWC